MLGRGHLLLVIKRLNKLLERFTKKDLQKTSQKKLSVEKVIKSKRDKLYIKWKG